MRENRITVPKLRNPKIVLVFAYLVIAIFLTVGYFSVDQDKGENALLSILSILLLLAVSFFAALIYLERYQQCLKSPNSKTVIWLLIAIGFAFLAIDETYSVHEEMDLKFHEIFDIQETALTDRIDDFLILVYAIIGYLLIWIYRSEILLFRSLLPWLAVGFILMAASVATDALTNRDEYLQWLELEGDLRSKVHSSAKRLEELLELFAEIVFLIGFITCYKQVCLFSHKSEVESKSD